jgi:hypothetical protein
MSVNISILKQSTGFGQGTIYLMHRFSEAACTRPSLTLVTTLNGTTRARGGHGALSGGFDSGEEKWGQVARSVMNAPPCGRQ